MDLSRAPHVNLDELERQARELLPPEVYDYVAGGSGAEQTLADNVAAWQRWRVRPPVLAGPGAIDLSTTMLGERVASPVLLAPTAYHRLLHPDGELAMARGAAAAGSLYVVSSRATVRLEEIAAVAGPWWFQVYVMRERALSEQLARRAEAAGARALVLTGDTPVLGRGLRDRVLKVDPSFAVNVADAFAGGEIDLTAVEQAPDTSYADLDRLVRSTSLPVLVKGVLRADDALRCLDAGAAGVIVSNHGGRQLDGAVATADALPEVVAATAQHGEVYVDGGIRHGIDVLRALALGARGVLVGRPPLWGLATGGADGVAAVLAHLAAETARALAMAGYAAVSDVDEGVLEPPSMAKKSC